MSSCYSASEYAASSPSPTTNTAAATKNSVDATARFHRRKGETLRPLAPVAQRVRASQRVRGSIERSPPRVSSRLTRVLAHARLYLPPPPSPAPTPPHSPPPP